MKKLRPAKLDPVISAVCATRPAGRRNRLMPIAARQAAKISTVPPASSGTSDHDDEAQLAIAAPTAAANAEAVQNRAASNLG